MNYFKEIRYIVSSWPHDFCSPILQISFLNELTIHSFSKLKYPYQTVGPKNLPVAVGFGFGILIAASKLSILLFATLTPHQLGIDVFVGLTARIMTIVQMANPVSSPADVM